MLATYLLTALVSLSATTALPSLSRRQEGYIPLAFTSELPETLGSGEVIRLSWTGGSGIYHVQIDSSNTGSKYSPVDAIESTTETTFEYTVPNIPERIAFAIFDVEQFATGEPVPGSWANTGYMPVHA